MNVDYKVIGQKIKEKRKNCGYTQEVLAEKLEVTVEYISQVERGITKISLDLLAAVSAILKCDIAALVAGSSTDTEQYLISEIGTEFAKLTKSERKIVLDFIKLLLNNRKD